MKPSLPTPPTDQDEPIIINYVDLNELTFRRDIEPNDDQIIHVYSAPRDRMVETGDIVYRRNDTGARFYHVDYATTMRYPAPTCTKICNRLPYQLFLQLDPITDPSKMFELLAELKALDALPY
jgi:hypothetical protein